MKAIQDDIYGTLRSSRIEISPTLSSPSLKRRDASKADRRRRRCGQHNNKAAVAKKAIKIAGDILAETLWPTRCALCDTAGNVLCQSCADRIEYIDVLSACPRCGAPHGCIQCSECNDVSLSASGLDSFPFAKLTSSIKIDSTSKRLVTVYKDHDEHRLAPIIAKMMCRYIDPSWLRHATQTMLGITFIPSTSEAIRRRGFDHMEELAALIATYTGLVVMPLFERPRSKDQRTLNRKERLENMKRTFTIRQDAITPHKVLLIDDINTTGSTLFGAAQTLKEHGCKEVYGLTLGKVC